MSRFYLYTYRVQWDSAGGESDETCDRSATQAFFLLFFYYLRCNNKNQSKIFQNLPEAKDPKINAKAHTKHLDYYVLLLE